MRGPSRERSPGRRCRYSCTGCSIRSHLAGKARRAGGAPAEPGRSGALANLRRKRDKLLQLFLDDKITEDYFAEQERTLTDKIKALEADHAESVEVERKSNVLVEAFERAAAFLRNPDFNFDAVWENANDKERRVLVEELIEAVTTFEDRLEVTVTGAPPLLITPGEVGLRDPGTGPVDVSGYVPTGSDFVSLTPARLVNTRSGAKIGNAAGTGTVLEVSVLGRAGLPGAASGIPVIGALAMNVTVTNSETPSIGGGYVTVFPCGTRPDASNLNFIADQTIANAVIAPISASGTICFYVYGTTHLLADVSGYFPTTNVVRFKVVDEAGNLLSPSGLLYCDMAVSTVQNGACNPPASAAPSSPDGFIRVPLAPDKMYRINAFVTGTGWPCPWVSPTGQTFHFSPPFESLGSSLPGLSTLTIAAPTPSAC